MKQFNQRSKGKARLAFTASLAFAIAFTISCSGAGGSDGINGADGKDADCIFEPKPQTDSLLIICNDKLVGTISNGKNGVNGIDGRDGANGIDGKDGADGQNCDVADSGAYFVMRCGGVEKAIWAKAICGAKAYDPAEMECNNNALSLYFIDSRDNRKYKAVIIGSQTWMAENLKFYVSGSLCYSDFESNCYMYGRLYDWAVAKTACPSGWHLPSDAEWLILTDFIDVSVAGVKLKAKEGWNNAAGGSGGNGTDDYGFSALPGGYKSTGNFASLGYSGYWQSATETDASRSGTISIGNSAGIAKATYEKTYLFSVRCVKD